MEKLLDWENSHLYNKLGLKWKLARQRCDSTLMMEYVSYVNKVDVVQGVYWGIIAPSKKVRTRIHFYNLVVINSVLSSGAPY